MPPRASVRVKCPTREHSFYLKKAGYNASLSSVLSLSLRWGEKKSPAPAPGPTLGLGPPNRSTAHSGTQVHWERRGGREITVFPSGVPALVPLIQTPLLWPPETQQLSLTLTSGWLTKGWACTKTQLPQITLQLAVHL